MSKVSQERVRKAASDLINFRWGNSDANSAAEAGRDMRFWQLGGDRVVRAASKAIEKVKAVVLTPEPKPDRSSYTPNFVIIPQENKPQGFTPSKPEPKQKAQVSKSEPKKPVTTKVATQAVEKQSQKYEIDFSQRLPRPTKIVDAQPEDWGLSPKRFVYSGVPAKNAIPRKIEGVEDLLKMSDRELLAIASMGGMQKTPEDGGGSSPYKWSRGVTNFGLGLNEGYSVADVVHFYATRFVPSEVSSKWNDPTRLTEALKNGEISPDDENIKMGLNNMRQALAKEVQDRKKNAKKYGFV